MSRHLDINEIAEWFADQPERHHPERWPTLFVSPAVAAQLMEAERRDRAERSAQ